MTHAATPIGGAEGVRHRFAESSPAHEQSIPTFRYRLCYRHPQRRTVGIVHRQYGGLPDCQFGARLRNSEQSAFARVPGRLYPQGAWSCQRRTGRAEARPAKGAAATYAAVRLGIASTGT
jgi:hypothetical protein